MLSAVLEVALGLSFLFFVLSLICSALNEAIAGVFALRPVPLTRASSTCSTAPARPTASTATR